MSSFCSVLNGGLGKCGVSVSSFGDSRILLAASRRLIDVFLIESFKGFFQEYPRYFEGVPLSYKKFVFDISYDAARDVTELEVIGLSKSKGVEYS